ncbi:MAG TPA: ATP-binding protein [Actinomycetota bacterium]
MEKTLDPSAQVAECRHLAEVLRLDAVGIAHTDEGARRIAWWAVPEGPPRPLDVDEVLAGRVDGWVVCPRGDDLIFARLTPDSSVRSAATLRTMLANLTGTETVATARGGVAPDDPVARDRTRWAYAVHDGLTQVVTAAVLDLEWKARKVESQPDEAISALSEAAVGLRAALGEIRGVLAVLTPEQEDDEAPLEELVQDVLGRWQLPASWTIEGDVDAVPRPILEAASSVIRESVANAAKHSSTHDVSVRIHASRGAMEVSVEDRGRGFRPTETGLHAGHLGLEMMRRRVAEVHGSLDIRSEPGHGTRVVATLPVGNQGDEP